MSETIQQIRFWDPSCLSNRPRSVSNSVQEAYGFLGSWISRSLPWFWRQHQHLQLRSENSGTVRIAILKGRWGHPSGPEAFFTSETFANSSALETHIQSKFLSTYDVANVCFEKWLFTIIASLSGHILASVVGPLNFTVSLTFNSLIMRPYVPGKHSCASRSWLQCSITSTYSVNIFTIMRNHENMFRYTVLFHSIYHHMKLKNGMIFSGYHVSICKIFLFKTLLETQV